MYIIIYIVYEYVYQTDWIDRERERDRETERQRNRETERQRDRETERQRDRETERQRDRETETERQRQRQRERERSAWRKGTSICRNEQGTSEWGNESTRGTNKVWIERTAGCFKKMRSVDPKHTLESTETSCLFDIDAGDDNSLTGARDVQVR